MEGLDNRAGKTVYFAGEFFPHNRTFVMARRFPAHLFPKQMVLGFFAALVLYGCRPDEQILPQMLGFFPEAAGVNNSVEIKGRFFDPDPSANTVLFNGVRAVVTKATDSTLTATGPAGATTGKITVTARGQTVTSGKDFTIPTGGRWRRMADFPGQWTPTSGWGAAIGDRIYFGMGVSSPVSLRSWWEYDPASDRWRQLADLPGDRDDGAYQGMGFVIGGRVYFGTGRRNGGVDDRSHMRLFWEYDPPGGRWARKADFPDSLGRIGGVAFALDGKGYAGLGLSGPASSRESYRSDWWEYSPASDRWTRKADMPVVMQATTFRRCAFSLNGKGYVMGGSFSNAKDCWEYTPGTDKWRRLNDGPTLFFPSLACTLDGRAYVKDLKHRFYSYDPAADRWTLLPDHWGAAELGETPVAFNGKIYSFCGNSGAVGNVRQVWAFTPDP